MKQKCDHCLDKNSEYCVRCGMEVIKKEFIPMNQETPPTCFECGKPMESAYDPITKKLSKYLWHCQCYPNRILSVG